MEKNNPFFTASMATFLYLVVLIMLKYFLQHKTVDWQSDLLVAIVFWIVIFLVHQLLNRRYGS